MGLSPFNSFGLVLIYIWLLHGNTITIVVITLVVIILAVSAIKTSIPALSGIISMNPHAIRDTGLYPFHK